MQISVTELMNIKIEYCVMDYHVRFVVNLYLNSLSKRLNAGRVNINTTKGIKADYLTKEMKNYRGVLFVFFYTEIPFILLILQNNLTFVK
ncbi:hypothetical protein RIR_jg27699.t1 [Rhizophagus irregularis DAOM 181602=DAOM 197198]|nr:hypothetical protein RIR_jg27699.t1 [Rhizophagus irregularis DAOM 181602=DAOM 197198]